MYYLVAAYPFKGTMTSREAAEWLAARIVPMSDDWTFELLPLGDGGSGTLDALMNALGGEYRTTICRGPRGEDRECKWGITGDGVGVIEAAQAIALSDIPPDDRDPSRLSSYPIGQLIIAALDAGASGLTIGLGDTATHDCGLGAASALGYRFLDDTGKELEPVGASLRRITHIDLSGARQIPDTITTLVYCDVLNPLCGPDGAALRFAGQKGADPAMIEELEEGSRRFADIIHRDLGRDVASIPGAGAAGGLGAALAAFCNAQLIGGAEGVLDAVGFDERLLRATTVITGEGRLDEKTLLGKGVLHVVRRARRLGKRVLFFTGGVEGEVGWWEKELGAMIFEIGGGRRGLD